MSVYKWKNGIVTEEDLVDTSVLAGGTSRTLVTPPVVGFTDLYSKDLVSDKFREYADKRKAEKKGG